MYARLLLLANLVAIGAYVLWQGLYRFSVESFGTWMLSPLIVLRLSPPPMRYWFLRLNAELPIFSEIVCLVPVLIFTIAAVLGTWSGRRGSLPVAMVACTLMTSIFVVYHSVKHLGMRLVIY